MDIAWKILCSSIPYQIEIRSLQTPYYRPIGLAMKRMKALPPAVQKFIEYLPFREKSKKPGACFLRQAPGFNDWDSDF